MDKKTPSPTPPAPVPDLPGRDLPGRDLPCLTQFAEHLRHRECSPLTAKNYLADLGAFARWFEQTNGDRLTPDRVTPTDLREFKRHLIQGKLRPASINRKLATLKSFLKWATDAGLTTGAVVLKMPKAERQTRLGPRWLDRREQNALLRAVERGGSARDLAAVTLMLHCGLRVAELCALTWADVAVGDRKGVLTVRSGKGGKRREVPLNADARVALLALGYSGLSGRPDRMFLGQRGPLTPRGVQSMLTGYARAAGREGLDGLSPHALRHTFCKNLVDAGVGLEQVAALASHESLDTTRRYTEPSLRDLEKAVELISEGN